MELNKTGQSMKQDEVKALIVDLQGGLSSQWCDMTDILDEMEQTISGVSEKLDNLIYILSRLHGIELPD